jgi:hypothetical protein
MVTEPEWTNPVPECEPSRGGYWLAIWTGYRWEYFAGPYASHEDAFQAKHQWCYQYCGGGSDCVRIEEFWCD